MTNNDSNTKINALNLQRQVEELRVRDDDFMAEETSNLHQTTNHQPPPTLATSKLQMTKPPPPPYRFIPLTMGGSSGRTHVVSNESRKLIQEEVTLDDLETMTHLFYDKAFQDKTLDKFIRSHNDPHGTRFAKWIHQKLSGSTVWDQDRMTREKSIVHLGGGGGQRYEHVVHDRTSAHVAAWYSPKRPKQEMGRHFELDECRVWMRLHFWALRQSGIVEKSPSFADYYIRFIGHFVRVYESSAPRFARDSWRWSESKENIKAYLDNGRHMNDVLSLTMEQAEEQIPELEANDFVWPYNTVAPSQ